MFNLFPSHCTILHIFKIFHLKSYFLLFYFLFRYMSLKYFFSCFWGCFFFNKRFFKLSCVIYNEQTWIFWAIPDVSCSMIKKIKWLSKDNIWYSRPPTQLETLVPLSLVRVRRKHSWCLRSKPFLLPIKPY